MPIMQHMFNFSCQICLESFVKKKNFNHIGIFPARAIKNKIKGQTMVLWKIKISTLVTSGVHVMHLQGVICTIVYFVVNSFISPPLVWSFASYHRHEFWWFISYFDIWIFMICTWGFKGTRFFVYIYLFIWNILYFCKHRLSEWSTLGVVLKNSMFVIYFFICANEIPFSS